ncbi:hypothetical protein VTK73DRAFT_9034 [Phialemonium thermophilum]|uniref:Uncharacterized protein n=1 Tax=Phialemonium thermophilum TaxID=223376 RepID=A0ABR3XMB3_9PEZI
MPTRMLNLSIQGRPTVDYHRGLTSWGGQGPAPCTRRDTMLPGRQPPMMKKRTASLKMVKNPNGPVTDCPQANRRLPASSRLHPVTTY